MDRVPRPRLLCGAVSTSAGQSSPMQPVIQSFLPSGRLFRRSQLRWYAVKADHTVMWSGVNVSWPVFADATCYSVVPAIRKTISSFAIAMVCGEGGSHCYVERCQRQLASLRRCNLLFSRSCHQEDYFVVRNC